MRYSYWMFLVIGFVLCCSGDKRGNLEAVRVDFYYVVEKPIEEGTDNLPREIAFSFYEQRLDSCGDTTPSLIRGMRIKISEKDSVFSLRDSAKYEFTHQFNRSKEFISERITEGELNGILIGEGLWRIKAKTKYFDFSVLVDVNERSANRANYVRTKCW